MRRATTSLYGACALSLACSSSLPVVAKGQNPQHEQDRVIVDERPPVVRIEEVPPQPGERCKWLDGHWRATSGSWQWQPGAWVIPPDGCVFAPPFMAWVDGQQLYYWNGLWVPAGHGTCEEAVVCGASSESER